MIRDISTRLRQRLALPLPGAEAQYRMANAERRLNARRSRIPSDCRKGGVLILLYPSDKNICFPLILRQEYQGVHGGQVGLPGGAWEEEDGTLVSTALREAQEETGIFKNDVDILGRLTELYIPASNFLVYPTVGVLYYKPVFIPDPREVADMIEVNVDNLMEESTIGEKEITLSTGKSIHTPYFRLSKHEVWGATAMILSEFRAVMYEVEGVEG